MSNDPNDRELLVLIAQHERLEAEDLALMDCAERDHGAGAYENHPEFAPRWQAIARENAQLLEAIAATQATTARGVSRKLSVGRIGNSIDRDGADPASMVARAALADLERMADKELGRG